MKTLFLVFVFFILSTFLSATIINIPADQPTIQAGINVAVDGDTVLVQPGTYVENINYSGKNITVASLFLITQDTTYISQTIIDGDSCGSVVTFESGEDATAKLTGFTITNGYSETGGGIYCYYNSNPTIENCTFDTNSAYYGGGIYCCVSSPTIVNCIFNGNSAGENGGGICCFYGSVSLIENCTFRGNSAMFGGGIKCWNNSSPMIKNCILNGNWADEYGGGIDCAYWCNPTIEYCTISGNSAQLGAGISSTHESNPEITNCTISENSANENGGGIWCESSSSLSLVNCILWNDLPQEIYISSGSVTATYSDIEGSWVGIGNINANPLFADPQNGDFHLTWANFPIPDSTMSPCIDAGNPSSPLDPDSTIADMGAYYFDQNQMEIEDISVAPISCKLYHNYPNPFNPSTTISFELTTKNAKDAKIEIYNIKGQKIRTFPLNTSTHTPLNTIMWNGADDNGKYVSSGVYFFRLKVNDKIIDTKKGLLLK